MSKTKKTASIEALYKLEVKDKHGKVISSVEKPCKSFVIGFLNALEATIGEASVNVKDIDGTSQAVVASSSLLNANGPIGSTARGIQVGTGTTPVDNLDYAMETLIAHGVGAGQLSYGAGSKVTTAEVGANVDFQKIRTFTNTNGGTINVTEIGITARITAPKWALILHEIVTLTAVLNGQTLTVTITFRTTV